MQRVTIRVLKSLLVAALLGSLLLQLVMVPLTFHDMDGADPDVLEIRLPLMGIIVLGIATTQVVMVCLWRLVSMVRSGTVFSESAFRYVDITIGAIAVASVLLFALGVLLAPGEAVAPGVVLLIGCAGAVVAGIALVVVVMRFLLAQAVGRDIEAVRLKAELDEVI